MAQSDLDIRARAFAQNLRNLLNKTVCDTAQVAARLDPPRSMYVGTGVTGDTPFGGAIGLSISRKAPHCWLNAGYYVVINENGFLTVSNSFVGVSADPAGKVSLVHYDFERDKDQHPAEDQRYTEAHLQIDAASKALTALSKAAPGAPKDLDKLHLPVGGRRFRPCLEDVIEFLIRERLVAKKRTWEMVLRQSRQDFQDRQLGAAIRHRPEIAIRELDAMGYEVVQREKSPSRARTRRR